MFSRILSSVRGVLPGQSEPVINESPSPIQPEIIRELRGRKIATPSPKRTKKMVSTRRQSVAALEPETPSVQLRSEKAAKAIKTPNVEVQKSAKSTPSSSSRKRRKVSGELEEIIAPPSATPKSGSRRSKRVAQRESREGTEESEQIHTHFEKSIPLSSLSQEVLREDSDAEIVPAQEIEVVEEASEVEVTEGPEKRIDKFFEAVVVPALPPAQTQPSMKNVRSGKAAKRSKAEDFFAKDEVIAIPDDEDEKNEAVADLIEETKAVAPPNKRKRFGSEDPVEVVAPVAPTVPELVAQEESEDESSEDEAPEVVATTTAQEQVQKAEREAAKAAEKQEALRRQKRQEKDAQLKTQAVTASKKRKAVEAPPSPDTSSSVSDAELDTIDDDLILEEPKSAHSRGSRLLNRDNLPTYLPDSYLEDEIPPSALLNTKQISKPNKIKFLNEPKVKDVRMGNTKIRVSKKEVEGLAPKINKRARNMKEEWLSGRVNGKDGTLLGGGVRKKENGGGFFVNKRKNRDF